MPPPKDQETDEEKSANDRDIEEVRNAAKGKTKEAEPDEPTVIDLDEEEEKEADKQPDRSEKRSARYRENKERAERLDRELAEERAARQRSEDQARLFQAQLTETLQRVGQKQQEDPVKEHLSRLQEQQDAVLADYDRQVQARTMTDEKAKALRARIRELQTEEARVIVRHENQRNGGLNQGDVQQQVQRSQFQARYQDIAANRQAMDMMIGHEKILMAKGKPGGWETADEAARLTRKDLGWSKERSEETKARFTGMSSSGAASGGRRESNRVELTKADKKMAMANWPGLKPEEAYVKMAKLLSSDKRKVG